MPTLGAYHFEGSAGYHVSKYEGPPMPKVTGKVTPVPEDLRIVSKMFGREFVMQRARNEEAWQEWAVESDLPELDTVSTRIGDAE